MDVDEPRVGRDEDRMPGTLYGPRMAVQSPEGQAHVRKDHDRKMAVLDKYPTIRRHVFNDKWADTFLQRQLAHQGDVLELLYPAVYGAVRLEEIGMIPRGYLAKVEAGLDFIIGRAPRANRTDLIGNLQKANSLAATFEILLNQCLVAEFGEEHIEPYPRIADGSKKSVESAVTCEGTRLYFEATVLFDDAAEEASKRFCIKERLPFAPYYLQGDEGVARLLNKCKDKAMQRELDGALVLCIRQFCTLPHPRVVPDVMTQLVTWAESEPQCPMIGVAHYWQDYCQGCWFSQSAAERLGVPGELLERTQRALSTL